MGLAKLGGIPPLITWLNSMTVTTQAAAAHAVLCLACDNATMQVFIAKSDAIPPLIALVAKSSAEAQEFSARALWHLASQPEIKPLIALSGGIKPLIGMLGADGDTAPELAAVILVRLARSNPDVSVEIAEKGGILPLVKLVSGGSSGSQQQAASCLAELALVLKNRDMIANAQGIEPIIKLLVNLAVGTPETAARVLAHVAHEEPIKSTEEIEARRALLERLRPKLEPLFAKQGASPSRVLQSPLAKAADEPFPVAHRLTLTALGSYRLDRLWMHVDDPPLAVDAPSSPLLPLLPPHQAPTPPTGIALNWELVEPKLMAADSLDELMENPVEFIGALDSKAEESRHGGDSAGIKGAAERRTQINQMGGVRRLISMLDGSNLTGGSPKKGWVPPKTVTASSSGDAKEKGLGLKEEVGSQMPSDAF